MVPKKPKLIPHLTISQPVSKAKHMDKSYKEYLEALYSSIAWSKFIDFYEPDDTALSGYEITLGPTGFLKRDVFPSLMISSKLPREQINNWMMKCLEAATISNECYLYLRLGPWAHIEILDITKWLVFVWGMKISETNNVVGEILLLNSDKSKILFLCDKGEVIEVYISGLDSDVNQ